MPFHYEAMWVGALHYNICQTIGDKYGSPHANHPDVIEAQPEQKKKYLTRLATELGRSA